MKANVQRNERPTSNESAVVRGISVERWTLDVGRWTFEMFIAATSFFTTTAGFPATTTLAGDALRHDGARGDDRVFADRHAFQE